MEWILFTIGLLVGGILGMMIVGIVSSGKMSDLDSEIISLRIQRNLLKDELLKQKPKRQYKKRKYKPRKKHKNAFGRGLIQPQKHKKNPFRSKPIPKSKIEWAIQNTRSIRAASKFLGVSYNTFKKYAKMYDLFEQNKNAAGVGVNKGGDRFNTEGWLSSILSGNHPNYPDHKLLNRLIKVGWLIQECSNCGYSEFRKSDSQSPLLLDYIDKDKSNRDLSNLRTLCYNCFFIFKKKEKKNIEKQNNKEK